MNLLFLVLLALVIGLCLHFNFFSSKSSATFFPETDHDYPGSKGRERIISSCNRKLAKNPQNYEALRDLAAIYFGEQNYIQALPLYELIFSLPDGQTHADFPVCAMNLGITAAKLNQNSLALKSLEYAITHIPENFELCFNLANIYSQMGDLSRAIVYYEEALKLQPADISSQIGIAECCYRGHDYKKAIPVLQLLIDDQVENPALIFMLADSLYNTGNPHVSEKYFRQLYNDKIYGVRAALALGDIAMMNTNLNTAYECYSHAMELSKTISMDQPTTLSLYYNMGQCCLQMKNISKGLELFFHVQGINPDYKNVKDIISSYEEINRNKNLCIYTIGSTESFTRLCQAIVFSFFKHCVKKIINSDITSDYVEMTVQVTDSSTWEDVIVFRFYRSKSQVGELAVRDLYAKTHEVHAGRAFCFVLESFTEGAIKFCDGRQVVLYDREKLIGILNKLPPTSFDEEDTTKIGDIDTPTPHAVESGPATDREADEKVAANEMEATLAESQPAEFDDEPLSDESDDKSLPEDVAEVVEE